MQCAGAAPLRQVPDVDISDPFHGMKLDDIKAEIKKTRAYQWAEAQKNKAGYWLRTNPTGQKIEGAYRRTTYAARQAYGRLPEGVRSSFGMIGSQLKSFTSGTVGKVFAGFSVIEILKAHGIIGKIKETIKQVWMLTVGWKIQLAGVFFGAKSLFTQLVRGTGSLEAALARIGKMNVLARVLSPFVGGMANARRKVAELYTLAAKSPFNVEQWGAAAKTLAVLGHGALSDSDSLNAIGDAAAASGNSVEAVAQVVGDFYAAVREGRPVGELTEQMRQMGIVSEGSAATLRSLADSGGDVADMTRELNAALSASKGGMEALSGELEAVNKHYTEAQKKLSEKFGMPAVESEIKNTENYALAMDALAEPVGRLAQFFQNLFGTAATWFSSVVKGLAENDAFVSGLERLGKMIGYVVVGISGGAVLWLGKLAVGFIATGAAASILSAALIFLMRTTIVGGLLLVLGVLIDKFFGLSEAMSKSTAASDREAEAHDKARRAMEARIAAIQTLIEQQEALKQATDELLHLDKKTPALVAAAENEKAKNAAQSGLGKAVFGESHDAQRALEKHNQEKRDTRSDISAIEGRTGLIEGAATQRLRDSDRATAKQMESAQERLREARGENGTKISLERLQVTRKRAGEAQGGLEASAEVEKQRAKDELEIQRLRGLHQDTTAAEARKLGRGLNAPSSSSVNADTYVSALTHAQEAKNTTLSDAERQKHTALSLGMQADPQLREWFKQFAERQREQEGNAPSLTASVTEQAADMLGRMQPVASNLARIGGGGNVSGPMDQIPRDQLAVLREILTTLQSGGSAESPLSSEPDVSRPGERP